MHSSPKDTCPWVAILLKGEKWRIMITKAKGPDQRLARDSPYPNVVCNPLTNLSRLPPLFPPFLNLSSRSSFNHDSNLPVQLQISSSFVRAYATTLATWCKVLTHCKRPWHWERLRAKGEEGSKEWDSWVTSPALWTWVWVNSGRQIGQSSLACHSPWDCKGADTT